MRIAVAAALLALAACDTLSVRTVGGPTFLYAAGDLAYVGGGRDLRVIVLDDGATLGGHEALQQAAIASLQQSMGSITRFTATPQNYDHEIKIALLFNPTSGISGNALCRGTLPPQAYAPRSASSDLHVLAVFCRNADVLTEVDGYTSGVGSAGDGRFKALISAVSNRLFPSQELGIGKIDKA